MKRVLGWMIFFLGTTPAYGQTPVAEGEPQQAIAVHPVSPIDEEMITTLALRPEQIGPYAEIMAAQRRALRAIPEHQWRQRLAVRERTVTLLQPVLDPAQLARFAAFLGCVNAQLPPRSMVSRH